MARGVSTLLKPFFLHVDSSEWALGTYLAIRCTERFGEIKPLTTGQFRHPSSVSSSLTWGTFLLGGFGKLFERVRKTFSGVPAKLIFSNKWNISLAKYASLNVKRPGVGQSRPNSGRFCVFEHDF